MREIHHPKPEEITLPDVLHALSDPVRLGIVETLSVDRERSCGTLGNGSISKSTLSHHLKVLREAGLTWTRVEGTQRLVSLRTEELEERFPGLLGSVLGAAKVAS
ncbi:MAG: helix-turn-helix transcriptional regulator [Thermoleophilaceae bacterium]|nr:helix-turn-helix transcriptional regulator [Thermoleophilaceae bacterium]